MSVNNFLGYFKLNRVLIRKNGQVLGHQLIFSRNLWSTNEENPYGTIKYYRLGGTESLLWNNKIL